MKKILFSLFVLCALSACPSVFAADAKKDKEKDMATDTDGPVTLTGMMAVKATDAKKGVVARFEGKKKGHWYNLIASGDLATQIETLRQEGDKVTVKGKRVGDDITVESVSSVKNMKK